MITVRNPAAAANLPAPPRKPDGALYRYEMILPGAARRGYAENTEQLLDLLAPGYLETHGPRARAAARIDLAVRAQVHVQAQLADPDALARCTDEQRALLLGARALPPAPAVWDGPVPLVLVTTFYQPTGRLARPREQDGGQVWWIDPTTPMSLLTSLHTVGWIRLADSRPGDGA